MEKVIKVSMFKSVHSRYASGVVNLWNWLLMRNPYTALVEEIRREHNPIRLKRLKELLPAITVSCVCIERRAAKIFEYTHLICIDIDGKDNPSIPDMEKLKKRFVLFLMLMMQNIEEYSRVWSVILRKWVLILIRVVLTNADYGFIRMMRTHILIEMRKIIRMMCTHQIL